MSKIKISKAIHNHQRLSLFPDMVVISVSKIKISKAIHNKESLIMYQSWVVISVSKIKISKAIHNGVGSINYAVKVVISVSQCYHSLLGGRPLAEPPGPAERKLRPAYLLELVVV